MGQALVNGLLVGANYALLALGYTLVFGVMRLLTLAHGQVFMASGLLALLLAGSGTPIWAVGVLAVAIGAALGLLTNEVCFRPLGGRHEIAAAVATIGLGFVIANSIPQLRGSSTSVAVPFRVPGSDVEVGGVLVSTLQLVSLVLALALMAGTHLFVNRTKWGVAMRGLAGDAEVVALLGVPVRRLTAVTMLIAGALAGVSAYLLALRDGSISPLSGFTVGLYGLAIMTIGGLGNLTGAVIAGLALGVAESVSTYLGAGGYEGAVPWIMLIVVLLLRPLDPGVPSGASA